MTEHTTSNPPEGIGRCFAADVIKRSLQLQSPETTLCS